MLNAATSNPVYSSSTSFWNKTLSNNIAENFPVEDITTRYASNANRSTARTVSGQTQYPCITVYFNEADKSSDISSAAAVENFYTKDKMTVVFKKGYRPAYNGVGTRLHYKDGTTLKRVYRDASQYSKLGGRDCIIVDTGGCSNVYKVDVIFYLTAKPSSLLCVEQIILGEAYDFNDFESYEVTEQCAYLMDDMPYNVLTAELRADENVKLTKGMTVINRINGNPHGVFKAHGLIQTGKNQWSLTANDISARLDGLSTGGEIYGGGAVIIDMSYFFRFLKFNTGVDIYEGLQAEPITINTNQFAATKVSLTTRGYCNITSFRKALLMHTQAIGSMLLTDREGKTRFRSEGRSNGTDVKPLGFYYTTRPDHIYNSESIMGESVFEELPKCRKISFKMYDVLYELRDNEDTKVATAYLPAYGQGDVTVILNECYTAIPDVYLKNTSTRVTFERGDEILQLESQPFKFVFHSNNSAFSGGEVDVYVTLNRPQTLNQDFDLYSDGEYDYIVDNTLISSLSQSDEHNSNEHGDLRAIELATWLQQALRSPGTVKATIICENNNVPELGDIIQIETAWQGIKQGMLTRITVGSEDVTVADVEIACFPETNIDGSVHRVFAELNGLVIE